MGKLGKTYDSIENVIADLDGQINAKNAEIEDAKTTIAELEVTMDEQYEYMKLRIQYIYESNDMNYGDVFLSSGSIAEMLERMEYVANMMEYDRNQLKAYQNNLRLKTFRFRDKPLI